MGNLIVNGNFEGKFTERGAGELVIAEGWSFGYDPSFGHRPEWKPEQKDVGKGRVLEGAYAQKWFTTYAAHHAWLYQSISGVTPGEWYRLVAHVYVWSSRHDDADRSAEPGKVWVHAGIHPWGDANALVFSMQWGTAYVDQYDHWLELEAVARAKSDKIVAAVASKADHGVKHNDVYLDRVTLELWTPEGGGEQPPPPEPGEFDYARIEQMIAERPPVRWPR
jgi:hypothetical protein